MSKPIYLFSTSSHPQAKSINSLDIKLLKPSIDFSKYDYLIITSKQAIAALKQYNKSEYIHIPALCISEKSAEAYEEIEGKVLACANGYGNDLPKIVKKFSHVPERSDKCPWGTKKWLYLRGEIIASDFAEVCRKYGYNIDEEVVYESRCSNEMKNIDIKEDSILIFTSPSSIKCFLNNHTIPPHASLIVIGKTTAKVLPKNVKYHLSKDKTIQSCIDLAINL